eukprot:11656225-Alexandrium_andersonii.AAC.1
MCSADQPAERGLVDFPTGPSVTVNGETPDTAWVRGAAVDPFDLNAEMQAAVDEWAVTEADRMSEDDWQLTEHDSVSGRAIQFAHQIKDGLGEFFICRNAQCAFAGRNADWAHTLS